MENWKIGELAFTENYRIGFYGKIGELAFTENYRIGFYGKLKNWLLRKIGELAFTENWCKIRVIIKS